MFTRGGEATLHGKINIDDYGIIDGTSAARDREPSRLGHRGRPL